VNSEQMKFLLHHGWRNVWLAPGSKDSHASRQHAMEAVLVGFDGSETASIKTKGHRGVFTVSIQSLIIKPGRRGGPAGMDATQFREEYLALGRADSEREELKDLEKLEVSNLPAYFQTMPEDSPARAAIARLIEIKQDLEEYRELLEFSVESANKRLADVFSEESKKVEDATRLFLEAKARADSVSDALNKAVVAFNTLTGTAPRTDIRRPPTIKVQRDARPTGRAIVASPDQLTQLCQEAVAKVLQVGSGGGRFFYASEAVKALADRLGRHRSAASDVMRKLLKEGKLGKVVRVDRNHVAQELRPSIITKMGKPSQWYKVIG